MGRTSLSLIFEILFATPGLDFNAKDSRGNTPVHVAAWCSDDRVTCTYVLPIFVQKAMESGFDFTTLGEAGQSVLHIVARTSYPGIDSVKTVLELTNNAGLNTLSASGATALFYAINHCHLKEAHSLLNAGADPALYGAQYRCPMDMIEKHLANLPPDSDVNKIKLHGSDIMKRPCHRKAAFRSS